MMMYIMMYISVYNAYLVNNDANLDAPDKVIYVHDY